MKLATNSGPKARHVKAWAGVRVANGGPGNSPQKSTRGLKGRNHLASPVPPFQGGEDSFRLFTWGFTPGYHMTGFQPSKQRRLLSEPDALQAELDVLRGLPAEIAAELDASAANASVARVLAPPATSRAGMGQRAIPTIPLNTYRGIAPNFRCRYGTGCGVWPNRVVEPEGVRKHFTVRF